MQQKLLSGRFQRTFEKTAENKGGFYNEPAIMVGKHRIL